MKTKIRPHKTLDNIYKGAKEGEIYRADNNFNENGIIDHYMVILSLEDPSETTFIGVMLTSSKKVEYANIEIPMEYFKTENENGKKYAFPIKTTLLTQHKRIKYNNWAPFHLVGELTNDGLKFIQSIVSGLEPSEFEYNKK